MFSIVNFFSPISNDNHEANMSIEERASLLAAKYSSKYDKLKASGDAKSKLKREDRTDDLMKSIQLANSRRAKRIEDMMCVEGSVIVSNTGVVAPDDQVRTAKILAKQSV